MIEKMLHAWMRFVIDQARSVLTVLAIITALAGYHAISAFSMNSDTGRLIRQDTAWKQVHNEFIATFPQYDQNSFVVVSGHLPDATAKVARALASEISQHDDIFRTVYAPASNDFVDRNMLLFLDPDDLNDTVSKLAEAQPFLAAVAEHESLRGVLTLLTDAVSGDEPLPTGFSQIVDALTLARERAVNPAGRPVSWRDELFQVDRDETYYQVIFVQGRQDFGRDLPNALIINRLQAIIDNFNHPFDDEVRVRLTGQVPLEHGEIVSAMNSAQVAGSLALVILIAVLVWGVRSARIIAATYLSMVCGLIWTASFAMFTVGQYNTISIIFLVMFIGLGVDFAVHLCLRYQEALSHTDKRQALIEMGTGLGPAIMLCGVTSAIGFLAFVPTEYIGLGEMGIISGGGMIIAVIISLTLIPAFFAVTSDPKPATGISLLGFMTGTVASHPRQVAWGTLVLACVLVAIATQAKFDYSTLSLKDPDSEAMTTLRELHDEDVVTDYALTYMATDLQSAEAVKTDLLALPEVSEVKTPLDFLPEEQDEKRFILEDAGFLLDSVFYTEPDSTPYSDADLVQQLQALDAAITSALPAAAPDLADALNELQDSLRSLITSDAAMRERFSALIVPPIKSEIRWLQAALSVEPVTLDSLPGDLKDRLISGQGHAVVSITPAEDVVPVEALRRFTRAVMEVVPNVTGRPVLDLGIGDIVIVAFLTAIGIAVASIFVILLVTLRNVIESVLVFIPLMMTAMVTLAVSVLADMPLNMANVVVIPLIFGLGVDNGIHIVKRFRQSTDVAQLVDSSTPRAVFLSNLTTLGTFCALSFSTHQGIYSIGVLLTVALVSLMLLTLVSLPALLATFASSSLSDGQARTLEFSETAHT